ncbi:MAG: PEGA domain-containing protein [Bacteroidia bacterium]|nr:PEGA domain-containing protein [Bacteroidia bacterium]
MRYRILFLLLAISISSTLFAQLAVKSFTKLGNDLTARIDAPKRDQNGDLCAIIKVVTTQTGFGWEPDGLGIVAAVPKIGEYWLYIPYGAKRLTIKHPQLGILRDYMYPLPIEKATVYELMLVSGTIETIVKPREILTEWVIITSEPSGADVYIDDKATGITTPFSAQYPVGKHSYRLNLDLYHPDAGRFEIVEGLGKVVIESTLKPTFGQIVITSSPESGAKVTLDNIPTEKLTPCTLDKVVSGVHLLSLRREGYEPVRKQVTVVEGEKTVLEIPMTAIFGTVNITASLGSEIYIDDKKVGTEAYSGRLNEGIYTFEARKPKHTSDKQKIQVIAGVQKEITLNPTPQLGTLEIQSFPINATITLDGENRGTTPTFLRKLMVGNYSLTLSLPNYEPITKEITIVNNDTTKVKEVLTKNKEAIKPTEQSPTSANESIFKSLKITSPKASKLPNHLYLEAGTSYPLLQTANGKLAVSDLCYHLRVGSFKKVGLYAAMKSNLSSSTINLTAASFPIEYYGVPTTTTSFNRFGAVGGLMLNAKPIMLYAGAGWGYYKQHVKTLLYKYLDDSFVKEINLGNKNSFEGLETEAGIVIHGGKGLALSLGVSSIEFKYFECALGLGFSF